MNAWLSNQLGQSAANIITSVVIIILVIIAIMIIVKLIRRINGKNDNFIDDENQLSRLSIRDALAVDNVRRLVLVRRDDVEHLILIGGPTDIVVEQHIIKNKQQDNYISHHSEKYKDPEKNDSLFSQEKAQSSITVTKPHAQNVGNIHDQHLEPTLNPSQTVVQSQAPQRAASQISEPAQHIKQSQHETFDEISSSEPTFSNVSGSVPAFIDISAVSDVEGRKEPAMGFDHVQIKSVANKTHDLDEMFEDELQFIVNPEKR